MAQRFQRVSGPGWVGGEFFRDTSQFLTIADIASELCCDIERVKTAAKRSGVRLRPCRVEATYTVFEQFTDAEAKLVIATLRSRG